MRSICPRSSTPPVGFAGELMMISFGRGGHSARLADVPGDRLAQLRQARRRAVMRGARVERALGRLLDVLRRVEVRLADLEVHDLLALPFQRTGAREHLERRFRSQPSHPFRDVHGAHYSVVDFVEVGAGEFLMGDADGAPCERPAHHVRVDAFAIAVTPVTNAAYARYLAAARAAPPAFWGREGYGDSEQPVVGVSWDEACAFAAWADARLP